MLSLLSWAILVYSDVDQLANVHSITVEVSFAIDHAVYFTRNILFCSQIYHVNAHGVVYWEHQRMQESNQIR